MEHIGWLTHQPTSQAHDGVMWVGSNPKVGNTPCWMDGNWHESVTTVLPPRVDKIRVASRVISWAKPAAYRLELCVLEPGHDNLQDPRLLPTNTPFPHLSPLYPNHPRIPPPGGPNSPPRGVIHYIGVARFPPGEAEAEKKRGRSTEHDQQTSRLHGPGSTLLAARCFADTVMEKTLSLENRWKVPPCLEQRWWGPRP